MVVGLAVMLSACGDGSPHPGAAEPAGLQVRVRGIVSDGALCPGGQRPCLPLLGDVEPDEAHRAVVRGRLDAGVLVVDAQDLPPPDRSSRVDECGSEVMPDDSERVREGLTDYIDSIPEAFAASWLSISGTHHLGVVGDAGPHLLRLMAADLVDAVCVVGRFERSRQELDEVMVEAAEELERIEERGSVEVLGGHPDPDLGAVVFDVDRIDAPLATEIVERFGDAVRLRAPYEVLDGTFGDLDAALDELIPSADVGLEVRCGDVRFGTRSPDADQFDDLDDDARSAIDAIAAGPGGDETRFFDRFDWRLADRTEDRVVVLGVTREGEEGFASAAFRRVEGAWAAEGFGTCRIEVSAVGLEPARTQLDPDREPDPAATELSVLINEQACANGEAPAGREIVPVVVETASAVEIVVLVAPVAGAADCPGNPWHPISVPLEEPLGDRAIFDGSTIPPVERSWPPAGFDRG